MTQENVKEFEKLLRSDEELKAVAGGSWCLIIGGGHDSDSNTVETENGAGMTGFGTCEYVGIGLAYY